MRGAGLVLGAAVVLVVSAPAAAARFVEFSFDWTASYSDCGSLSCPVGGGTVTQSGHENLFINTEAYAQNYQYSGAFGGSLGEFSYTDTSFMLIKNPNEPFKLRADGVFDPINYAGAPFNYAEGSGTFGLGYLGQNMLQRFAYGPIRNMQIALFDSNSEPANAFITNDPVVAAPGVPEPATWASMAAGFGLIGAALRGRSRRRGLA